MRCRHAIKEPGCVDCAGFDNTKPLARRFCDEGFRHALKETWCPNCRGSESSPETSVTVRHSAIAAASPEEKSTIRAWRENWQSLCEVLCHWCKRVFHPRECHADHVMPLSRGGKHALSNLVIACASCNVRKSARMPNVWAEMIAAT